MQEQRPRLLPVLRRRVQRSWMRDRIAAHRAERQAEGGERAGTATQRATTQRSRSKSELSAHCTTHRHERAHSTN